jgi:hypothetical protein
MARGGAAYPFLLGSDGLRLRRPEPFLPYLPATAFFLSFDVDIDLSCLGGVTGRLGRLLRQVKNSERCRFVVGLVRIGLRRAF